MEVHAPHKPIQSIKEFLVHLLAITIGLLIALGLESAVEWVHHRHQAQDARENIMQEVRANQLGVLIHFKAMTNEQKRLEAILAEVIDLQMKRPAKPLGDFNWTYNFPVDSAWNATSSSGAIAYMHYRDVKRYSKLYDFQKLYSSYVQHYLEERHEMNVLTARLHAEGRLSDAEFESIKRIIQSEILRTMELQEMDQTLNSAYSEMLSSEK
jgi:hypothetical protein